MSHSERFTLIIGNKNYSTWSLRGWLILHAFGIKFDEINIELFSDSAKPILDKYSPTKKVPVLIDHQVDEDNSVVWDSLAIAMYLSDSYPNMWGKHSNLARSLVAEMHSGFMGLRNDMAMNIRATRKITPSDDCLKDIKRVELIFSEYRQKYAEEGDYLLGEFSLADVFFAPLAFRFKTYNQASGIQLNKVAQTYIDTLLKHPSMQLWQNQALLETSIVKEDEVGEDV